MLEMQLIELSEFILSMYRLFLSGIVLAATLGQVDPRALWTSPETSPDITAISLSKRHVIAVPRDVSGCLGIESTTPSIGKRDDDRSIQNPFNDAVKVMAQGLDDGGGILSNDDQTSEASNLFEGDDVPSNSYQSLDATPSVLSNNDQALDAAATSVLPNARETIGSVAIASNTQNEDTAQAENLSMQVTPQKDATPKSEPPELFCKSRYNPAGPEGSAYSVYLMELDKARDPIMRQHQQIIVVDLADKRAIRYHVLGPWNVPMELKVTNPFSFAGRKMTRFELRGWIVPPNDMAKTAALRMFETVLEKVRRPIPRPTALWEENCQTWAADAFMALKSCPVFVTYQWMEDVPTKPPDASCFV